MPAEEREALLDGLLAEILENPDAAFRADAELFQDFLVRCRIRRVPGAPMSLSAFRRKMAVAALRRRSGDGGERNLGVGARLVAQGDRGPAGRVPAGGAVRGPRPALPVGRR